MAEEVEKVNPDLVIRDKDGKPYTVRYEAVNAMLLNEFLKEHQRAVEDHRKSGGTRSDDRASAEADSSAHCRFAKGHCSS